MKLNKKAALSLSVQAIVILVIAFVVLGLALTLTRYIFGVAQEKAGSAIDIIELESKPTSDNPITMPERVIASKGEIKDLKIGVYNIREDNYINAILQISDCIAAGAEEEAAVQPGLTSLPQDIGPSESAGYKAILSISRDMPSANYICTLKVMAETSATVETLEKKDEKQFYLIVTS